MEPMEYIVIRLEGDYALLQRTDKPVPEPLFIARALLPAETDEGSRLRYEMLEYQILE